MSDYEICCGCGLKTKYVCIINQKMYNCCKYGDVCQKLIKEKILESKFKDSEKVLENNIDIAENILLKRLK